ncbi:MAG: hypothetical protein ACT4PY_02305 [Armatimonadota bacterium]
MEAESFEGGGKGHCLQLKVYLLTGTRRGHQDFSGKEPIETTGELPKGEPFDRNVDLVSKAQALFGALGLITEAFAVA